MENVVGLIISTTVLRKSAVPLGAQKRGYDVYKSFQIARETPMIQHLNNLFLLLQCVESALQFLQTVFFFAKQQEGQSPTANKSDYCMPDNARVQSECCAVREMLTHCNVMHATVYTAFSVNTVANSKRQRQCPTPDVNHFHNTDNHNNHNNNQRLF